jgi:methyl-accepting chemotaxis protein
MKRWLSRYLSVLTLVPVIVLIVFISADVMRAYYSLDQANKAISDANLVNVTSQLTHELQKERGMSAGYIGSNGAEFKSEIRQQRSATDNKIQNLTNFMGDSEYDPKTEQTLQQLIKKLQNIQNVRQKVDSLTIGLGEALAYYSGSNNLLLDLNGHLAAQLEETTSAQKFLALYNIAYAKEQAGIERAVLSNVFASDELSPALLASYIELTTKQNTYIKSSYVSASPDFKVVLDEFSQSEESREVERFRDSLKLKQNGFNIDAADWFAAATARINKLKTTEEKLLNEMTQYAQEEVKTRLIVIVFESIILALMLALAYAVFSTIKLRAEQSYAISRFMKAMDTEKDLTDSIEVLTEDELGRSATLINVTFSNIRTDFKNFQKNAHEIAEATIQAASATEQSKDNLIQLQMDISSIASATEEMSGSIKSVMENMLVASDEAQSAAQETINGEKAVETSMLGISHTAEEVARVGETITELNGRVNDILSMVDVIKSVAEQTNLLALNAAIEAARAGEQGRGLL